MGGEGDAGCQDKGSEMHCMGRLHQEWRKELERRKYTWFCEDMGGEEGFYATDWSS